MNKFQVLLFIITFFFSFHALSQSLVYSENAQKEKTIKDKIQEGKVLIVFEANFDLTIESTMEVLQPFRDKNLYKVFVSERSCVITIKNAETRSEVKLPFGQVSKNSLPILQKGEIKYFVISMEEKLLYFDNTENEKSNGASDNQMRFEREALLIFTVAPEEMQIDFKSTKKITEIRKVDDKYLLYIQPENQIITINNNETKADVEINIDDINVKEVRYYFVTLPEYLRKNVNVEENESEKTFLEDNQPSGITIETNGQIGSLTDGRDGKTYKMIGIGSQIWMAENLNYSTKNGSWCYNNEKSNCTEYGRLYDWKTAKKVCPSGWHLPSDSEWSTLTMYLTSSEGEKLKSKTGWKDNGNGNDELGFNALPGGYRLKDGKFGFYEIKAYWWTSSRFKNDALYRSMSGNSKDVNRSNFNDSSGFSVRCVKD